VRLLKNRLCPGYRDVDGRYPPDLRRPSMAHPAGPFGQFHGNRL